MKSVGVAACVAAALLTVSPASRALAVDDRVPTSVPGVRIAVRFTERLSSQEATTGQRFGFETTNEVMVGTRDVPRGTPGEGIVVFAQSGRGRNPGKLQIAVNALHLRDGHPMPVGLAPSEAATKNAYDAQHAGGFTVPTTVGTVVFGGITRDNNVVYEEGTPFTVITPPPPTPEPTSTADAKI